MTIPLARVFPAFVLLASATVLGTALASQFWGGLTPCELCLLERYPWDAALAIGLVATILGSPRALPWVAGLLAMVFLLSCAFAFYHVGVEQRWFQGPTACTAPDQPADTVAALTAQLLQQQPVRCDEVQWSLFGISLAGFNLIASLVMTGCCIAAWLRSRLPFPAARARQEPA
jgi:disulfide bond formation protein DsbB